MGKQLTTEEKMIIWGNTCKGAEVYPSTRTDEQLVKDNFTKYLHEVMHNDGEVIDDQY